MKRSNKETKTMGFCVSPIIYGLGLYLTFDVHPSIIAFLVAATTVIGVLAQDKKTDGLVEEDALKMGLNGLSWAFIKTALTSFPLVCYWVYIAPLAKIFNWFRETDA